MTWDKNDTTKSLMFVNSKNKMLKNRPSPPDASTEPENHKTNSRVKNQKKTYQKNQQTSCQSVSQTSYGILQENRLIS